MASKNPQNYLDHLVSTGRLKHGEKLYLKHNLPPYITYEQKDARFHGTLVIGENGKGKIRWDADGKIYSGTELKKRIIEEISGKTLKSSRPYTSWGTANHSLVDLAQGRGDSRTEKKIS